MASLEGGSLGWLLAPTLAGMTTEHTTPKARLALIVGSVREGRFGPVVARWAADQVEQHGAFDLDLIDLADFDLPLALPYESPLGAGDSYPRPDAMAELTDRLAAADAFLVVTPEYNHSYPASLKAAIDWHFDQWAAKPVAFVSYGGAAGGRHAVLHLENVFTELHAVTIRNGLSFPAYWKAFGEDGQPLDPDAEVYAKAMLEQLSWWADATRTARSAAPYPA